MGALELEDRLRQWHKQFYGRQTNQLQPGTAALLTLASTCIVLAFAESAEKLDIGKWRTPMIALVLLATLAVAYNSGRRRAGTRRAADRALEDFDQNLGRQAASALTYFFNLLEGGTASSKLLQTLEEMKSIPELSDWQILNDACARLRRGRSI